MQHESEHTVQICQHILLLLIVQVEQGFGIGIRRHEPVLTLLQLSSQLRRIEDLAVVNDPDGLIPVRHRLMSMLKIENTESPHTQTQVRRGIVIVPSVIRPAMNERVGHGPHPFRGACPHHPGYATHNDVLTE